MAALEHFGAVVAQLAEAQSKQAEVLSKLGAALIELGKTGGFASKAEEVAGVKRKLKETRKAKKDPNAPKRPLSGYLIFVEDQRKEGGMEGIAAKDVMTELGHRWKALTEEEKTPFNERAEKLKSQYKKQLDVYRAAGGGSSSAATGAGDDGEHEGAPAAKKARAAEESESEGSEESEPEEAAPKAATAAPKAAAAAKPAAAKSATAKPAVKPAAAKPVVLEESGSDDTSDESEVGKKPVAKAAAGAPAAKPKLGVTPKPAVLAAAGTGKKDKKEKKHKHHHGEESE